MKKSVYGIYDMRTHNFGDICILDRDEEFRDGCIALLSNPDIPDYVVRDLACVRYGSVSYDDTIMYPKFEMDALPTTILFGADVSNIRNHIEEDVSSETISEDN